MRVLVLALACVALAGCDPTIKPVVKIVTKEVPVPVPVKCKPDVGPRPDYPDTDDAIAQAPDIKELSKLYRAGRNMRIGREGKLEAALDGCAG